MESQSYIASNQYQNRVQRASQVIQNLVGKQPALEFIGSAYGGESLQEIEESLDLFHKEHGVVLQRCSQALLPIPHEGFPRNGLEILDLSKFLGQLA